MAGNQDTRRVKHLADEIAFTPTMTAVELTDELAKLSIHYPNDYQFGLIVRSVLHKTHINLKL